jgi:hypothetical protein
MDPKNPHRTRESDEPTLPIIPKWGIDAIGGFQQACPRKSECHRAYEHRPPMGAPILTVEEKVGRVGAKRFRLLLSEFRETFVSCRISLLEAGLRHFRMTAVPNCRPGKQTAVKR